jgi:hypothetical protein
MKTKPYQALKRLVEEAAATAIAAAGDEKFSRADLVRGFLNRGVSQATLYRWIGASIPPAVLVRKPAAAAALIEKLEMVVADLTTLAAHVRMPDGESRNAGLLRAVSDWITTCPEIPTTIQQTMRDMDQVDAIPEEAGCEAPAVAEPVEENMPGPREDDLGMKDETEPGTCGRCASYDAVKGSWCAMRELSMRSHDPACPIFEPAEETPD